MCNLKFVLGAFIIVGNAFLSLVQAAEVRLLVYGEHAGTDVLYHYTLVNNSAGKMMGFIVGAKEAVPGEDVAIMTLTRLPTGTTWTTDPEIPFPDMDLPKLNPGSVVLPVQPNGWSVTIDGFRTSGLYSIRWKAPQPVYGGPVNVTGADAGQTLTGFMVRVPANSATGPGSIGSLDPYVSGSFFTWFWLGQSWIGKQEQFLFAPIEKQDMAPPALSITLSPNRLQAKVGKLVTVTATINVTDNYDPQPEIRLESITSNEPLAAGDVSGADFGTDDRSFQLRDVRVPKGSAGRIYTVTYSATDGSGNKSTATATVSVK